MKTHQSENYTDPIVYEEGFFKDKEEETLFMNELQKKWVELEATQGKTVKKKMVTPERLSAKV